LRTDYLPHSKDVGRAPIKLPLLQIFEEPRLATIARAVANVSR